MSKFKFNLDDTRELVPGKERSHAIFGELLESRKWWWFIPEPESDTVSDFMVALYDALNAICAVERVKERVMVVHTLGIGTKPWPICLWVRKDKLPIEAIELLMLATAGPEGMIPRPHPESDIIILGSRPFHELVQAAMTVKPK